MNKLITMIVVCGFLTGCGEEPGEIVNLKRKHESEIEDLKRKNSLKLVDLRWDINRLQDRLYSKENVCRSIGLGASEIGYSVEVLITELEERIAELEKQLKDKEKDNCVWVENKAANGESLGIKTEIKVDDGKEELDPSGSELQFSTETLVDIDWGPPQWNITLPFTVDAKDGELILKWEKEKADE